MVRRRTSTAPGASAAVDRAGPLASRRTAEPPATAAVGLRAAAPTQLGNLRGRLRRLEVRPDDPADRVERGGLAVDQDGEVAGGDRLHGDDGAARGHRRRERRRVPEEEEAPSDGAVGGGLGAERRVVWVVGDQDRVRPRPRAGRGAGGAPERRRRSPRTGSTSPGPSGTSHVPSSSSPIGKHDGQVRGGRARGPRARRGRRATRCRPSTRHEALGRLVRGAPAKQKVTPEGETQMARTVGPAARPSQRPGPAGSWRPRRSASAGTPSKRLQQGRRVHRPLGQRPAQVQIAGEPAARPAPCRRAGPGRRRPRSPGRGRPARADGPSAPGAAVACARRAAVPSSPAGVASAGRRRRQPAWR